MVQGVSFLEKGNDEVTKVIKWGKVSANFSIR
jgi:hypothetical protein